jgi:hypothetical protein
MEIKPVGRERDRQIAKLTEIVFYDYYQGPIPYYSTSLQDAWPLWEEMKESPEIHNMLIEWSDRAKLNRDLNLSEPEDKPIAIELWIGDGLREIDYEGKTEADAISGAWLMWRANHD